MADRVLGRGTYAAGWVGRRMVLGAVVLVSVTPLISCTPQVVGVAAVGTDAQGNLVAVTDGCGEDLTFMTLRATADGGPTATAANGQLLRDESEVGRYEITDGRPRLTVMGRVDQLRAGVTYSVSAWDGNQSSGTGPVTFRADEIVELRSGEILPSRTPGDSAQRDSAPMTAEQWMSTSCADKR